MSSPDALRLFIEAWSSVNKILTALTELAGKTLSTYKHNLKTLFRARANQIKKMVQKHVNDTNVSSLKHVKKERTVFHLIWE